MKEFSKYVGLDVHKATIAVSVAEARQSHENSHEYCDLTWLVMRNLSPKMAKLLLRTSTESVS